MTAPAVSTLPIEQDANAFAELRREAQSIGAVLIQLDDGYLLTRWAWGRHLPDLDAVRALLGRMGGRR